MNQLSHLNSDLKILAKNLTSRNSLHIPTLIHADQGSFIPRQQISHGTRRIIDLIQWVEFHKMPSLLFSLDTEKVFDRIHWSYLKSVLQKFGFAGNINTAVLALYSHPSAKVWRSDMTSDPFATSNGTRQGCPLSPLIFSLVMEPLATSIQSQRLEITNQK